MPLHVRARTLGMILGSIILFSLVATFVIGYFSVPPEILSDSYIVHSEEDGLDIVVIHLKRSGWYENLILKIIVGHSSFKIYNSTHLVGADGSYYKYLATGVVTVVDKAPYGKSFQISGRWEPYDGHIIFWGSILTEEELSSENVMIRLERAVMLLPSRTIETSVKIELIQRIESGDHPRLFFSKSEINQLRKLVSEDYPNPMEVSFKEIFTSLREMADSYLTERYFTVYGRFTVYLPPNQPRRHADNFPYWTGITRQIQARLEVLSFVYLVTGEKAYAERAKTYMLFLSGWSQWTDPDYRCAGPRTCLDIGHLSMGVALAYDFIYETLDRAERYLIREALISKGIIPSYTEATEPGSWLQNPWRWPNGYAIVISGMGISSLAVLGEDSRAETWLETAINWTVNWLDRMGTDGGYTEGHTYATYASDFTSRFLYALLKVKGINLFSHPFMRNVPYFAIYSISPDGNSIVNFEDASYGAVRNWKETLAIAASLYQNRYAQWYLKKTGIYSSVTQSHGYDSIYHFIGFNADIEPLSPDGRLPNSKVFWSVGWAIFRTGWKENDTLFAFKCGPWGSHHHRDAADFVLNYQGVWLAAAPGYRLSSSTEAHNTLLIGGKGQTVADGQLIEFFNSSLIDFVSGNASKTYGEDVFFIRQITYVKPNLFLISDHVSTKTEESVSWIIHAEPFSTVEVSNSYGKITRRQRMLIIHMGSDRELSSSTGKTVDLPFIRYDSARSRSVRFIACLEPLQEGSKETSVEITFQENCGVVSFASGWGEGAIIFSGPQSYQTVTFGDIVSNGHVFGRIEKGILSGYFMINGTYLYWKNQTMLELSTAGHGALTVNSSNVNCQLYLTEDSWVKLYSPSKPVEVICDQASPNYAYDENLHVLSIFLSAGYHDLTVKI